MLTSLFTEIIWISDEKHTLRMGTNNQTFEFHQRPLHSAKGLIGMPVYFFQDKTRRLRSYWDALTFIMSTLFGSKPPFSRPVFNRLESPHTLPDYLTTSSGDFFWVRIISWNANIAWALRSRYIFWRHLKNAVYQINPPNLIPYPANGSHRSKHRQHVGEPIAPRNASSESTYRMSWAKLTAITWRYC